MLQKIEKKKRKIKLIIPLIRNFNFCRNMSFPCPREFDASPLVESIAFKINRVAIQKLVYDKELNKLIEVNPIATDDEQAEEIKIYKKLHSFCGEIYNTKDT
jgi:hypothetical protein